MSFIYGILFVVILPLFIYAIVRLWPAVSTYNQGNKKSILIVVVALVAITALSWFVTSSSASFALLLLIPFHLWLAGRLMSGGKDPTWAAAFTVTAGAVFGVMLWYSGWGMMLQNDVNYLNTEAKAKAAAGEGFFTGGSEDCENMTGVIRETPTTFTFRKDCVTYLDAALLKYGKDEIFYDYDYEQVDAKLAGRKPGEFVEESDWVRKDGRWVFKLVPKASAFGTRDSVPMLAYSAPLQ